MPCLLRDIADAKGLSLTEFLTKNPYPEDIPFGIAGYIAMGIEVERNLAMRAYQVACRFVVTGDVHQWMKDDQWIVEVGLDAYMVEDRLNHAWSKAIAPPERDLWEMTEPAVKEYIRDMLQFKTLEEYAKDNDASSDHEWAERGGLLTEGQGQAFTERLRQTSSFADESEGGISGYTVEEDEDDDPNYALEV